MQQTMCVEVYKYHYIIDNVFFWLGILCPQNSREHLG